MITTAQATVIAASVNVSLEQGEGNEEKIEALCWGAGGPTPTPSPVEVTSAVGSGDVSYGDGSSRTSWQRALRRAANQQQELLMRNFIAEPYPLTASANSLPNPAGQLSAPLPMVRKLLLLLPPPPAVAMRCFGDGGLSSDRGVETALCTRALTPAIHDCFCWSVTRPRAGVSLLSMLLCTGSGQV